MRKNRDKKSIFFLLLLLVPLLLSSYVSAVDYATLTFGGKVTASPPPVFTPYITLLFGGKATTRNLNFTPYTTFSFGGSLLTYGDAPVITGIQPLNNSNDIIMYPSLQVNVTDYQSNKFNITWMTNESGTWTSFAFNSTCSDGSFSQRATWADSSNTRYHWRVRINDTGNHWTNATYNFKTKTYLWTNWSDWWDFTYYIFNPPSNFTATHISSSQINLGWIIGTGATNTIIRYKKTGYPTSVTDGTLLYNSTGTSYSHTGLDTGTKYYYRSWGWKTGLGYTSSYSSAINYTSPGVPTSVTSPTNSSSSVTFSWTKGINSSHTLLRYSKTAYPTSVTDGTFGGNTTGTSIVIGGLDIFTKYYFSLWGHNSTSHFFSDTYAPKIAWTSYSPSNITNFTISSYNDTILDLSWTKGTGVYTVIRRKTTGYCIDTLDGTLIYNGTASTYSNTGLNASTRYYYTAWSFTGTIYSNTSTNASAYTRPQVPRNGTSFYNTAFLTENLSWNRGRGNSYNLVLKKSNAYSTSVTDGTVMQNATANITNYYNESLTADAYFTIWSYNTTSHLYSRENLQIPWGALGVSVFNESRPSQAITNWNIEIKNSDGTDVYSSLNNNNTKYIDVLLVPHGSNIAVKVWRTNFRERIMYLDLTQNKFYNISFYLPREILPPNEPGGGSGSNPNSSFSPVIYYIKVVETIKTEFMQVDQAVQGVKVIVQRYINTTGVYTNISVLLTDDNGYVSLYLVPSVLYQVILEKDGYEREIADYQPVPPNSFGQVPEKVFRMARTTSIPGGDTLVNTVTKNIEWTIEPLNTRQTQAFTVYFNITSLDCQLEWYRMTVYFYNYTTNTWTHLFSQNNTDACGGSISYLIQNITGKYTVNCYYKKIGFAEYEIDVGGSLIYFVTKLKEWMEEVPDYAYYIAILVTMVFVMGFCYLYLGTGFLTGYIGLGIMALAMLIKDVNINGISGWVIWLITFLMYTIGMFLVSRI